jgi:hypothetical protein
MRRLARSAALIAMTGVAPFALAACGGGGKKAPVPPQSFVHVGHLLVTVPRGFMRTEIRSHKPLLGALITDYRVSPGSPTLTEGVFPANGVALGVGRGPRNMVPGLRLPQLRLPLTLNELRGPQHRTNGTAWNGTFGFQGSAYYTVFFWVGRTASPHDRAAVEAALGSIRHAR